MKLILKYINTLEELKSIIVQNKDDEQFKAELVDSVVDGALQDWLSSHDEDGLDALKEVLDDVDLSKTTDSELLQILYDGFQIDDKIEVPDLSDCFEFVGIRVDGKDVTTQGITVDDNLRHAISVVVRVRKPMNEKLKIVLDLHMEKQQVSTKDAKQDNKKVPTNISDIISSSPDSKRQFPNQAMGSIVAGMVALKYSQLLQNNPNGETNRLTDENRQKLEEYIQSIRGAFGTLLMPPILPMAFAQRGAADKGRNAFGDFLKGHLHLPTRFTKEVGLNVASNTLVEVTFPEIHLGIGEARIMYNDQLLANIPINKKQNNGEN